MNIFGQKLFMRTYAFKTKGAASFLFLVLGVLIAACTVSPGKDSSDEDTPDPVFITRWRTDNPGTSDINQIELPLVEVGNYNFVVDWGDGSEDTITSWDAVEARHQYDTPGIYTVSINGLFEGWQFRVMGSVNEFRDAKKLLDVEQWGEMALGSVDSHFSGVDLVAFSAEDAPDLSNTASLAYTFSKATNFNGDISSWDVSTIRDMSWMFSEASAFNQALNWGEMLGLVTNMGGMFYYAASFNQDLSGWDVSSVTDTSSMFFGASAFNQALDWGEKSANIRYMTLMFLGASAFNQDIGGWNVSGVIDMNSMFNDASVFNQDIGSWDVSGVTNMNSMFYRASAFDQDIGAWTVDEVTNMATMFYGANAFNQDLTLWNVANVTEYSEIFYNSAMSESNQPSFQ